MATIYVRWIREARMTIEDVPARWRDAAIAALEEVTHAGA